MFNIKSTEVNEPTHDSKDDNLQYNDHSIPFQQTAYFQPPQLPPTSRPDLSLFRPSISIKPLPPPPPPPVSSLPSLASGLNQSSPPSEQPSSSNVLTSVPSQKLLAAVNPSRLHLQEPQNAEDHANTYQKLKEWRFSEVMKIKGQLDKQGRR